MVKILMLACLSVLPFLSLTAGDVKMEGEFAWIRRNKETKAPLKAVFTSDGKKKWKVIFNFKWGKKAKIYTGTAEGELVDGKLTGKILNDNKKRTFSFVADMKSGKLTGEHWEISKRRGKEKKTRTGTFTMSTK